MSLRAFVPLVTYPESPSEGFPARAAAFAALIDAQLHALAVTVDFPDVSNALSKFLLDTPRMIRDAEASSRRRGERLLAAVREATATAGVAATTAIIEGPPAGLADIASAHARYFDLTIIGLEAGNMAAEATAEAVIFGSGRPVVLLPENWESQPLDHIAVAWDGSRAAARAVGDAAFAFDRASRISVITVLDEKPIEERDAAARLVAALRAGGRVAEAIAPQAEDGPIESTLQRTAMENGCGLLVMGGYGHSRLRDFVLGGATQGVLTNLGMPVLVSH